MTRQLDGQCHGVERVVSPAPRATWRAVLAADPYALESQSPEWTDALCAAGGFRDASRLYVFGNGRTVVLPMLRRSLGGVLHIDHSQPPACGIGGPLGDGGVTAAEIRAVLADPLPPGVLLRSISPGPLRAGAWAAAAPAGPHTLAHRVHLLDLAGGWDEVWTHRFDKTSRRLTRNAERSGVTVERGAGGALLPEFAELVQRSLRRWAGKQHEPLWLASFRLRRRDPLAKYEAIAGQLGDRFSVWLARLDGRPVAASLVAQGTNAHDFRGAMDATGADLHANDLLMARSIRTACEAGCRYYYLGESGWSPGLGQFKERFGARPVVVAEYRDERLPISQAELWLKQVVKRTIGFRD